MAVGAMSDVSITNDTIILSLIRAAAVCSGVHNVVECVTPPYLVIAMQY